MTECQECRDWRKCTHDGGFFSYSDIRFCALQCFWILKHAEELRQGRWPLPDERAEVGAHGRRVIPEAPFAKVVSIIAEIEVRLERTGWRGKLLIAECKDQTLEKIDYLSHDAKDALYYMAGWKRKETNFNVWRATNRYRKYNIKKGKRVAKIAN